MGTTNQASVMIEEAKKYVINKGPNLIGAILILVLGMILARIVCRLLRSWLEHREMEPPVRMLFTRVTWLLIMALFVMVALGTMGIQEKIRDSVRCGDDSGDSRRGAPDVLDGGADGVGAADGDAAELEDFDIHIEARFGRASITIRGTLVTGLGQRVMT